MDDVSLYGEAIKAQVPHGWKNVAEIRQVPDNQEVFVESQNTKEHGFKSIIFELVEPENTIFDKGNNELLEKEARFHIEEIAKGNSASCSIIKYSNVEHPLGHAGVIVSRQKIETNDSSKVYTVPDLYVSLVLLALEEHNTVFLISVNWPVTGTPNDEEAQMESRELAIKCLLGVTYIDPKLFS